SGHRLCVAGQGVRRWLRFTTAALPGSGCVLIDNPNLTEAVERQLLQVQESLYERVFDRAPAERVDRGIVRMAQPCGPKHACDRTADRDPFAQSLHAWLPHGHHTEPDRPELTGSTEQKARSQPCEPKHPLPVDPRPTHCDAWTT